MGKSEIIRELSRLNASELAEVRARLDELTGERTASPANTARVPKMASPRLANRSDAAKFAKLVSELPPDA